MKLRKEVQKMNVGKMSVEKRIKLAEAGKMLGVLVHDNNWLVRLAVAEQGYGLDVLVHDKNEKVREAVAKQGYGLDKLVHDECPDISEFAKVMLAKS